MAEGNSQHDGFDDLPDDLDAGPMNNNQAGSDLDSPRTPKSDDCQLNSPRSGGMPTKKLRSASPASSLLTCASPPRFISFDQLMQAAESVSKMTLAHEIAVDDNFKLEKREAPEASIEKRIKDTMFRAFWDSLREKLDSDPPDFSHALVLLEEVKENLKGLLLTNMGRIGVLIDDKMDMTLIQQQLDNGTLDLRAYADFVIDIMSRLCAPVRDETIVDLKKIEDPVDLYKEIFKVLEMMKMDMANFTISHMRPYIQQQSVTYERTKFQEFLDTQRQAGVDGLLRTRQWLEDSHSRLVAMAASSRQVMTAAATAAASLPPTQGGQNNLVTPNSILTEAYLQLLTWDPDNPLPETLVMDGKRLSAMAEDLRRLVLVCSAILITVNIAGARVSALAEFKKTLRDHASVILHDVPSKEFPKKIEALADQMDADLVKVLANNQLPPLDPQMRTMLRSQIRECIQPDNPVHRLLRTRTVDFLKRHLFSASRDALQIPPGLSIVETELTQLIGQMMRVLAHNRNVFGPFYAEIIQPLMKPEGGDTAAADR